MMMRYKLGAVLGTLALVPSALLSTGCTESTSPSTPPGFSGVVYGVGDGRSFVADFHDANCQFDNTTCEQAEPARRIYTSDLDSAFVQFENAVFWSCFSEVAPRYGCYYGDCSTSPSSIARVGGQEPGCTEFCPPANAGSELIVLTADGLSMNASQDADFDKYGGTGAANVCGRVRAAYQSIQLCMGYRYLAMAESVSGSTIARRGARFPALNTAVGVGLEVRDVLVMDAARRDQDAWSERFPPSSSGAASATFPWFSVPPQDDSGAATLAYQALSHFRNSAHAGSDLLRPECGDTELAFTLPSERMGPGAFPMDRWNHATSARVTKVGDVAVANFADAVHMLDESFSVFQRHVLSSARTRMSTGSQSDGVRLSWRAPIDSRLEVAHRLIGSPSSLFEPMDLMLPDDSYTDVGGGNYQVNQGTTLLLRRAPGALGGYPVVDIQLDENGRRARTLLLESRVDPALSENPDFVTNVLAALPGDADLGTFGIDQDTLRAAARHLVQEADVLGLPSDRLPSGGVVPERSHYMALALGTGRTLYNPLNQPATSSSEFHYASASLHDEPYQGYSGLGILEFKDYLAGRVHELLAAGVNPIRGNYLAQRDTLRLLESSSRGDVPMRAFLRSVGVAGSTCDAEITACINAATTPAQVTACVQADELCRSAGTNVVLLLFGPAAAHGYTDLQTFASQYRYDVVQGAHGLACLKSGLSVDADCADELRVAGVAIDSGNAGTWLSAVNDASADGLGQIAMQFNVVQGGTRIAGDVPLFVVESPADASQGQPTAVAAIMPKGGGYDLDRNFDETGEGPLVEGNWGINFNSERNEIVPAGVPVVAALAEILEPGSEDLSGPQQLCSGLPHNLRIPLENELTEATTGHDDIESSFAHYLQLARQAADEADLLGDKLIEYGLQMDMRAEGAQGNLESLCGVPINVGDMLFADPCNEHTDCGAEGECVAGICLNEAVSDADNAAALRRCLGGDDPVVAYVGSKPEGSCVCYLRGSESAPACVEADGDRMASCPRTVKVTDGAATCEAVCAAIEGEETKGAVHHLGLVKATTQRDNSVANCDDLVELRALWSRSRYQPAGLTTDEFSAANVLVTKLANKSTWISWSKAAEVAKSLLWIEQGPAYGLMGANDRPMEIYDEYAPFVALRAGRGTLLKTGSYEDGPNTTGFPCSPRAADNKCLILPDVPGHNGYTSIQCGLDCEPDPDSELNHQTYLRLTNAFNLLAEWGGHGARVKPLVKNEFFWESIDHGGHHMEVWDQHADDTFPLWLGPELSNIPRSYYIRGQGNGWGNTNSRHADYEMGPRDWSRFATGSNDYLGDDWDHPFQGRLRFMQYMGRFIGRDTAETMSVELSPSANCSWSAMQSMPGELLGGTTEAGYVWDYSSVTTERFLSNGHLNNQFFGPRAGLFMFAQCGTEFKFPSLNEPFDGEWWFGRDLAPEKPVDGCVHGTLRNLFTAAGVAMPKDSTLGGVGFPEGAEHCVDDDNAAKNWKNRKVVFAPGNPWGRHVVTPGPTRMAIMDALEIMCLASQESAGGTCPGEDGYTATIADVGDLATLSTNAQCLADRIEALAGSLYFEGIPKTIAEDISAGSVAPVGGQNRGAYGAQLTTIQTAMNGVVTGTRSAASALRDFGTQLQLAMSEVSALELQGKLGDLSLTSQLFNHANACATSVAAAFSVEKWGGGAAAAGATCANAAVQAAIAVESANVTDAIERERTRQVFFNVALQFGNSIDAMSSAETLIRDSRADLDRVLIEIENTRRDARREIAKVAFLGYDEATGREFNVNQVMRSRYNTAKIRYDDALVRAKQMSEIARLALEQRLGLSLQDIRQDLTLVASPSSWVNNLCSLSGIDYERIRQVRPDLQAVQDYSSEYIGDYVTKLELVRESYNFDYPFQDGDDVAVVSLRDEVYGLTTECDVQGPNLLISSGDLGHSAWQMVADSYTERGLSLATVQGPFVQRDVDPMTENELDTRRTRPLGEVDGYLMRLGCPQGGEGCAPLDHAIDAALTQTVPLLTSGDYWLTWHERMDDCESDNSEPRLAPRATAAVGRFGQVPLLAYADTTVAQFSRTTSATSRDYRALDGPGLPEGVTVKVVPPGIVRTDHRPEDPDVDLYLFEGPRTNVANYATSLDAAAWLRYPTSIGVAANDDRGPDATFSCDVIETAPTTVYPSYVEQYLGTSSDPNSVDYSLSAYHRWGPPNANALGYRSRAGVWTFATANSPWWDRLELTAASGVGSDMTEIALGALAGTLAPNVGMWGAQAELGSFPSSFIYTDAVDQARAADELFFSAENVPDTLLEGAWHFDVSPLFGSTDGYNASTHPEGLRNATFGLFAFGGAPGNSLSLHFDNAGDSFFRVEYVGAAPELIELEWDRHDVIGVDVNVAAKTIRIDGVIHAIGSEWELPAGAVAVGALIADDSPFTLSNHGFVRLSQPTHLGTSTALEVLEEARWLSPADQSEAPDDWSDAYLSNTDSNCWRRAGMLVRNSEEQDVQVAFGFETPPYHFQDTSPYPHVAWAAPQLEEATSSIVQPFFPTDDDLLARVGVCPDSLGETFSDVGGDGKWIRGCEQVCPDGIGAACAEDQGAAFERCYHEAQFRMTLRDIERGDIFPSGLIALGNYNYRFSDIAVNLIGTGLRDCSMSTSPSTCYASAYVPYSLDHNGPFRIRNHVGEEIDARIFPGRIQQAKALMAERYVTNPISSADRSLLTDYWRGEFKGRPLDGNFRLRIWDSPGFDFSKLEDIQLIMSYRYWTRAQ